MTAVLLHEKAEGIADSVVDVVNTSAGPKLYIGGILVRSWVGALHDNDAAVIADKIRAEIAQRVIQEFIK